MQLRDRITLRVEKAVAGGRMLARHHGAIALVAAAIPGELVEAEIEKIHRGTIWALTRRVIEASPDRVEPMCDWACGGTLYAHVRYERQLELKREVLRDAFARVAKLPLTMDLPLVASTPHGFRLRARLHARNGRLGFYREGTHELCDPGPTGQLLPETLETLAALERALGSIRATAVREVAVAENCEATERVLHLELEADADPSRLAAIAALPGVSGVSCAAGAHRRALTVAGSSTVTDTIGGVSLRRHARAFFQGNRYLLTPLVERVHSLVPPGRMLDLYAGVGLFSATIAARGDTDVMAVEGDRAAAEDLKHNISPFRARAEARHQPVEQFVSRTRAHATTATATVVVDPPRTGISKEALDGVLGLAAPRIVYVSCDVATLARDVRRAVERGYHLVSLEAFDMFPHTAHVESLALLRIS